MGFFLYQPPAGVHAPNLPSMRCSSFALNCAGPKHHPRRIACNPAPSLFLDPPRFHSSLELTIVK